MRARWRIGAGLALGLALGLAGLVSAQQDEGAPVAPPAPAKSAGAPKAAAAPSLTTPPAPVAAPAAPPEPAAIEPAAPLDEASDAGDDDAGPAASSKPGPAKPIEPAKRPRYAIAVIQALDKVSAETLRFEVPINQPVRYKSLIFIVKACETNAPDEPVREAIAHVEIISQPTGPDGAPPPPGKRVFRGWMFANAPGLDLFLHPVYDAWLIACKGAAPAAQSRLNLDPIIIRPSRRMPGTEFVG